MRRRLAGSAVILLSVAAAGTIVIVATPSSPSRSGAMRGPSTDVRASGRLATGGPRRPLKLIWGPLRLPNGSSAFPTYHELGVQVYETELDWAATAPTRPSMATSPSDRAYHWPALLDRVMMQAAMYGISVCLLVQHSPGWANGGRPSTWAPEHPADYANFLVAAARRYPKVRLWMIWGEPNRPRSPDFQPMPPNSPVGPRHYAVLLEAAYHALKSVSPSNLVIGGDTWSFGLVQPADFVRWMKLPNGKPPQLDYYGHNPFGRRFPNLSEKPYFPGGRDLNDIDTLESQLRGIYHHRVMLWLSEFTISTDRNSFAFDFHVSRAAQARWVAAAYKLVNSVDYVAGLGWFSLLDGSPTDPARLTNGLMTWDLRAKPAFWAYRGAS